MHEKCPGQSLGGSAGLETVFITQLCLVYKRVIMPQLYCGIISAMLLWAPEDAVFQVLQ